MEGRGPRLGRAPQPHARAAQPLQAPPPAARGRRRRPAEAARRQGPPARRRRPRLARRPLPGRRRRRHHRHHRHGRRRRVQPPAPDPPQHGPHRRPQGRLGQEDAHRAEPRRQRRHLRRAPRRRQRPRHPRRGLGRHRRRHRQLPDPVPRQRRVGEARHPGGARLDLPLRGHGHRVRPDATARPTATWSPSRRRPTWPPAAPKPACSACCPASSGRIQAIETIKLLLGLGDPLIGRLLAYDSLEQSFREYKVRVDPTNEITYANRDRIVVAELDGHCMPHPLAPPAD